MEREIYNSENEIKKYSERQKNRRRQLDIAMWMGKRGQWT